MKPYPLVEELLAPGLRMAMPRAVGSPAFLRRYIPPRGRRRTVPMPPQIQKKVPDTYRKRYRTPIGS